MIAARNYTVSSHIKNNWIPSEANNNKFYKIKETSNYVPKMYNLLETSYTPRQHNIQINLNIGIAASICDIIEFIEFNSDNKIYKPSKLFLYNIVYNYYSDVMYLYDYFEILDHYGVCSEESYPFIIDNINKLPNSECILEGFKNRNYEFHNVGQNLSQIQAYLLDNIPILFGFKTPIDGIELDKNNMYSLTDKKKYYDYGNMVIAYGYDNISQSLLIKYPLNNEIGTDGYFWLPYKIVLNSDICNEFTIITKKRLIKKLRYSYDNLLELSKPEKLHKLVLLNDFDIDKNLLFTIENRFTNFNSNSITLSYSSNKNYSINSNIKINNFSDESNNVKLDNYSISCESKELDGCEIKINI